MADRPNERTRKRDLLNIAKAFRGAAGAGPEARHPDALREYARRIEEWAELTWPSANRLTLYRDTWNQGAGGGGEGNGYSYRPDPNKVSRVYVPRFL